MIPAETKDAPLPSGPYSQAVISGDIVFVSGQIPIDPTDGTVPEGTEDQIRIALNNTISVLSAAGVGKGHVLKVTVYLTDMKDFALMNSIYAKTFYAPYPARTCVEVSSLPKGVRIMVDAVGETGGH
ncbi:MAG: Rid family detoxifying hydrolase [Candidatus Methanoplasma sp.]|jgi:2-iminobutanoate/2-iminopropanoate deaminase|nr:Rid family detoxifying hydrolase [Candidatus Methanoplasma sp.]